MPDELHELEAELKRLQPRAPSPGLAARLEVDLSAPAARSARRDYATATSWRSWKWMAWSVATAAIVAVALVLSRNAPPVPDQIIPPASGPAIVTVSPADIYKPVRADNVLYGTSEEGGVTLADGSPARRVRSQYVDTITWKNPRTNASLRWSIPREEVRLVPVSFH